MVVSFPSPSGRASPLGGSRPGASWSRKAKGSREHSPLGLPAHSELRDGASHPSACPPVPAVSGPCMAAASGTGPGPPRSPAETPGASELHSVLCQMLHSSSRKSHNLSGGVSQSRMAELSFGSGLLEARCCPGTREGPSLGQRPTRGRSLAPQHCEGRTSVWVLCLFILTRPDHSKGKPTLP